MAVFVPRPGPYETRLDHRSFVPNIEILKSWKYTRVRYSSTDDFESRFAQMMNVKEEFDEEK